MPYILAVMSSALHTALHITASSGFVTQLLDQAAKFRVSLDKHYCYPPVPGHLRVGGARRDAGERH